MLQAVSFGTVVKERRMAMGLTQAELGRRVGCAPITVRKIEADALRPSVQIAQHLAVALGFPEATHAAFVRFARAEREPSPLPTPRPAPEEIGQDDLSGRAIRGFHLGERLGIGGFGVVYRAVQATVAREVAVKIISPAVADRPEFVRRFEAEAQLVASLEHPYIVPLYDYWREPGGAYLVMRLMRGGSLRSQVAAGPLAPGAVLRIAEQICAALHTSHRAGVVHRDLKPANILLDDDGNAYLADFGIARQIGDEERADRTLEGAILGSPAYISPEQIRAEPVHPQTDIYSLGIMLYELLAGRKPFQGPTPVAYIQQHLTTPLPPLAAGTWTPMDTVIARATAKEPGARHPDALTLLADLRQVLDPGQAAAPPSSGARLSPASSPFATVEVDLPDLESPYKGLRPFSEADAADFFGRDQLVQELLARLSEGGDVARFLAVVGPSGGGKSSAVRAGLIPALRNGGLPGSEQWFFADLLPGRHPFEELEAALLRIAVRRPADSLIDMLRADERGLLRAVEAILPADPAVEAVLVIDQLEELFTLVDHEEERAAFLNLVVSAVLDPESRVRVITTLRADFTDQPLHYIDFGELIRQRTEFVLPLTPDELEQAIVRPSERAGLRLEKGLTATIIRAIGDQPGMLPLLQYALSELFERRDGRTLTLAAYHAIGGVSGALARRAEELYASLDDVGQSDARQLFLRLVTPGEGTEDTRRRALRVEIDALGGSAMGQVVERFGRYRLLSFDRDPLTRGPTVEVAHEALLREWGRLREWLNAARADIRQQRLLASAAAEWAAADEDESFLLRGARLEQFAGWASVARVALTSEERAFLEASAAANNAQVAAEEARRNRELATARQLADTEARRAAEGVRSAGRFRRLAYGLAALLVAAAGLALFAFAQRNDAQRNFERAEQVRLAAQAKIALDNGEGGDLPALLAMRSLNYGYTPAADEALIEALRRGFARQVYHGHGAMVSQVRMSPDGLTVLTSSQDQTAVLWDARTGVEIRRFGHGAPLNSGMLSHDGRLVLTEGGNTVRVWDAATGLELEHFQRETSLSAGAEFSPDDTQVLAVDGTKAVLWDRASGQVLQRFVGHSASIYWANFAPDGRSIVTASLDRTARIWDVATGAELRQLVGHSDSVSGAYFSPDGRYIVTASADRTARIWEVASGAEVQRFVGHTDFLYDAIFSPDSRTILTSSNDKTARLWDVASGRELRQFIGHTGGVTPSVFSPTGAYVLTGSTDRTARLWTVEQSTEPQRLDPPAGGHANIYATSMLNDGRTLVMVSQNVIRYWDVASKALIRDQGFEAPAINAQAITPDQRSLITTHSDGLVQIWDVEQVAEPRQLVGHDGQVWDIAIAADGRMALTGGEDGTARLWDLASASERQRIVVGAPVLAVALSPDGRTALTGGNDGGARLWDVASGRELHSLSGHLGPVRDVSISPGGSTALTGGDDGSARLWDVASGRELHSLSGHSAAVTDVAFSPDGHSALTGSVDQTARLWDVASGATLRQLSGHSSPVNFVAFSADGSRIITSDTQAAYLWRASLAEIVTFACEQLSRDLSADERARYEITGAAPTCPSPRARDQVAELAWTAVPPGAVVAQPVPLGGGSITPPAEGSVAMTFIGDKNLIAMNIPIQDVFVDAGNGQVVRPTDLNTDTLSLPVYSAAIMVPQDFEEPYDKGPYPMGAPLGFTLGDWVGPEGSGTYTASGGRAVAEMSFDRLVPNGVYTLWCVKWSQNDLNLVIEEPCGAADGSQNSFVTDAQGHAEVRIEMDALPPSTPDRVQEIAIAYHSDGLTHGPQAGDHGRVTHAQMVFDFMPPEP